ncbi:MAG: hypothetical protein ACI87E_002545 [Mariniblastus sp.]|jgi:hypothetical protein
MQLLFGILITAIGPIVFGTAVALSNIDSQERDFAVTGAAAIVNFDR